LTQREGRGIQVGIVETKSNRGFTLGVGESANGITLVRADLELEEALLQKGSQTVLLKLSAQVRKKPPAGPAAMRPAPGQATRGPATSATAGRPSARRRVTVRKAPSPPPLPIRGRELRQHLREYNLESIRKGLPPLPIELTPAEDDQLVLEGVLPPTEDSFSTVKDPALIKGMLDQLRSQDRSEP
jgi:hypothetical protein